MPYSQDPHLIFSLLKKAKIPFITTADKLVTKDLDKNRYKYW